MYEGEYHNIRHRMMSNERPGPEGASDLKQGALLVTGIMHHARISRQTHRYVRYTLSVASRAVAVDVFSFSHITP